MGESISDSEKRVVSLAKSFPCLASVGSLKHGLWNPAELDAWALKASSGERHAVSFVLTVWNQYETWKCGKFDVFDAAVTWNDEHRRAFFAWMTEPWFA